MKLFKSNIDTPFKCYECNKSYSHMSGLCKHNSLYHKNVDDDEREYLELMLGINSEVKLTDCLYNIDLDDLEYSLNLGSEKLELSSDYQDQNYTYI